MLCALMRVQGIGGAELVITCAYPIRVHIQNRHEADRILAGARLDCGAHHGLVADRLRHQLRGKVLLVVDIVAQKMLDGPKVFGLGVIKLKMARRARNAKWDPEARASEC